MKNYLSLFIVLGFFTVSVSAQIKVQSNGKVSVGTVHSLDNGWLQIGTDGYNKGLSFYDPQIGGIDFKLFRQGNVGYISRGDNLGNSIRIGQTGFVALGSRPTNNYNADFDCRFTVSQVDHATISARAYHSFDWGDNIKSIVYRPTTVAYCVWYNGGTQTFKVYGNGDVYSAGQYIQSDLSTKNNIQTIESPLKKVLQLRGVTFDYNPLPESVISDEEIRIEAEKANVKENGKPAISRDLLNQISLEKKRKRIGVIAQEVEAIVPEAVRTAHDGIKAVAYSELVGLLIEAIKEQQIQIETLKSSVFPKELRSGTESTAISTTSSEASSGCKLFQNTPNPFNASTEIRYTLASGIQNAHICIFNMQGTLLKRYPADISGSLVIHGTELSPGMYLYSLIADGKEVDTKRMILTD